MSLTKDDIEVIRDLITQNNVILETKIERIIDARLEKFDSEKIGPIGVDIQFMKADIAYLKRSLKGDAHMRIH